MAVRNSATDPRDACTTQGLILASRSKVRPTDVLIVDDDAELREFLVTSLTLEGYQVAAAANGADALAYLRRWGPVAVILLDLSMPVMDGWTFCRQQQSDEHLADITVILSSASLDTPDRPRPIVAALEKPIDFREVLSVIRTYCPERKSCAARSPSRRP